MRGCIRGVGVGKLRLVKVWILGKTAENAQEER